MTDWTDELVDRVSALRNRGKSITKISELLSLELGSHISYDQIRYCVRNKIPRLMFTFVEGDKIEDILEEPMDPLNISSEETIGNKIEREIENYTDSKKIRHIKTEYKQLLDELSTQREIIRIVNARLDSFPGVTVPTRPDFLIGSRVTEEAVIVISDTHVGELVSPEVTGGIAEYSVDIFALRLQYLAERVIDLLKNKMLGYHFTKLHIILLGDIVCGTIHEDLVETSEGHVVDWTFAAVKYISKFIMDMCAEFEKVEVTGVVGNHGRVDKKKKLKQSYVNWDYVVYKILELKFENQPNLTFDIPKSFFRCKNVNGKNFLFLHGDTGIRSYMGIPWYGIQRASFRLAELLNRKDMIIDYIVLAHFHNSSSVDRVHGGEILVNGSMIGTNEFSIGALYTGSHPKQLLFGTHKTKGKTFSFPIDLMKPEVNSLRYK